jgi:hypothetical protein
MRRVAAPGVVYENAIFHMFVQTDFMAPGGMVEYLTSSDGCTFTRQHTALTSLSNTDEAGVYDPHPTHVQGKKYLVYSGTPNVMCDGRYVIQPDIYLARSVSGTWTGPWQRLGKILDHADIAIHHNQRDCVGYEWGIEGAQLVELKNGTVLLNAVCFLPEGMPGTRQRVFFAVADAPEGPYRSLGPVLNDTFDEWENGENGHAAAVVRDDCVTLFYQARSRGVERNLWRYGVAEFELVPLKVEA